VHSEEVARLLFDKPKLNYCMHGAFSILANNKFTMCTSPFCIAHIGRRGYPGEKGDPGGPPSPSSSRFNAAAEQPVAAFSASLDEDVPRSTEYRVLRFNVVLANHGACYDPSTGVFTAPFNGSYLIGFGGVGYDGQSVLLHLVRNGQRLLSAFDNSGCSCITGHHHHGSVASASGTGGNSKDTSAVAAAAPAAGSSLGKGVDSSDSLSSVKAPAASEAGADTERGGSATGQQLAGERTMHALPGVGVGSGSSRVAGGQGAQGGGGKCAGSASNAGVVPLDMGDRVWIELPDGYGMHNALYHHYASFYGYLLYTAAKVNAASTSPSASSNGVNGITTPSGRGKQ
jgi:C1q domain